jgi:hypothetical protein
MSNPKPLSLVGADAGNLEAVNAGARWVLHTGAGVPSWIEWPQQQHTG